MSNALTLRTPEELTAVSAKPLGGPLQVLGPAMLSAAQLALRKSKVTATDATAIVGVNPYRTPLQVWQEKVSTEIPEPITSEAIEIGQHAEGMIMELLAKRRGLVLAPGDTVIHPIFDWIAATPDRIVLDARGKRIAVAEAKMVGFRMASKWGEAPPDYVQVQVQWQMIATSTRMAYVAALLGTELLIYEQHHDQELADALVRTCAAFWERFVVTKTPPPPTGRDEDREFLTRYFAGRREGMLKADGAAEAAAALFFEARAAREEAQEREDEAANVLRAAIGDHEGIEGREWRATWKHDSSGGVDWKSVANELGAPPELVARFTRPGPRKFLCKQVKPTALQQRVRALKGKQQ
jgi:putative phage-type endonuclease